MAKATFTGETASGWQQVKLASPLTVTTGKTYVASYYAPVGRYSATNYGFSTPKNSGLIDTPANAGVYRYGTSSGFPTSTYQATNYWVDVNFTTTTPRPAPTPPRRRPSRPRS